MKVTPPLAVTPLAQEDDMRWNPNDDGMAFNPSERCAPDHNGKHFFIFFTAEVALCRMKIAGKLIEKLPSKVESRTPTTQDGFTERVKRMCSGIFKKLRTPSRSNNVLYNRIHAVSYFIGTRG